MFLKKKKEPRYPILPADADMSKPEGQHYLDVLMALHSALAPEWYLEIGTQKGTSLALAKCNAVAIDPKFMLKTDVLEDKESLHLLQATSDDAFASDFLKQNPPALDFCFLDGMHLFEFILRDFMNAERLCKPDSVIAVHDCLPFNRIMAKRTWDKTESSQWTGDVWKIVPALKMFRPELHLQVLDCAPTGLLLISRLQPENTILRDQYSEIEARFLDMTIEDFGIDQFNDQLKSVDSVEMYANYEATGKKAAFGL